ncbi:MAG: twin-arginine translocase TatA/TatE family subunit [Rubrobacter sp.]|nr:twin-arginine translocase TatA/TatE family subunit [Rubrobacter sp.]
MSFGFLELFILLFIVFLILGPKRIPGLLRALGRGVKDFTAEFSRERGKELPGEDREDGPRRGP